MKTTGKILSGLFLLGLLALAGVGVGYFYATGAFSTPESLTARQKLARQIPGGVLLWSRQGMVTAARFGHWEPRSITRGENPRWAPDGRRFVFTRGHSVWLMQNDLSAPRKIMTDVFSEYATGAFWTEDGKGVVAINRKDLRQVLIYDLALGKTRLLHDERRPPYRGYHLSQGAHLRFGGRYLLTFTGDAGHRSMIIDLMKKRYITNKLMRSGDCGPAWSPDGRFIVMTRRNRRSLTRPLYIAEFDAKSGKLSASRYLIGRGRCERASISNDGRYVLYVLSGNIFCWEIGPPVKKPRNGIQLTADGHSTDPSLYIFKGNVPRVFK